MSLYEREIGSILPLTPVVFHTLLALADVPRHGYRIMEEVNRRSEGRVGLGLGPFTARFSGWRMPTSWRTRSLPKTRSLNRGVAITR
jgi:hypothetical protein